MAGFVTLLKRGASVDPAAVPGEEALAAAAAAAAAAASLSPAAAAAAGAPTNASFSTPAKCTPGGPWAAPVQQQQLRAVVAAELLQQVKADAGEGATAAATAAAAAAAPIDSLQRVLQQLPLGEAAARLGVQRSTLARWGRMWSQKQQQQQQQGGAAAAAAQAATNADATPAATAVE
ncbi:hypothetical protein, conserved [Eimeria tenella]|uniref:Uncharacterized protein n=1 Tax=Eimeria tenella TaxID=5802 RepID=U6KQJ6_EIMTE|nr:hypothetical protein, conserved [Eimeria tenella]CDJ40241.1 hypothetical protein, conserved [Eimeria tenella]|eukprot:XP_013230994.1 hypothetical protein, conserved [Eimeria tenella]